MPIGMKAHLFLPVSRSFVSSTTFAGLVLAAFFASLNLNSIPDSRPLIGVEPPIASLSSASSDAKTTPKTPQSSIESLDTLIGALENLSIPTENFVLHELRQTPAAIAPSLVKFSKTLETIQTRFAHSVDHAKILMDFVSDCTLDMNGEELHEMARAYCFNTAKRIATLHPQFFHFQLNELKELLTDRIQQLAHEILPSREASTWLKTKQFHMDT